MKQSAGLLLYRKRNTVLEVLLVHPGGPFWMKKDKGAWSIPKGEFTSKEEPMVAARREFAEELGAEVPEGELIELGSVKQSGGKVVYAWALEADLDVTNIKSNTVTLEWPPRSGRQQEFPEIDKATWFKLGEAQTKLLQGQLPFLEILVQYVGSALDPLPEHSEQTTLF